MGNNVVQKIKRYKVLLENITPLRVGTGEDGISGILTSENRAMIGGTSIAGVYGEFLKDIKYAKISKKFSNNETISNLFFYDSLSDKDIGQKDYKSRPHIKIDSEKGVAQKECFFEEYYLDKGLCFEVVLELRGLGLDEETYIEYDESIKEFLSKLANGRVTLGAKSSFGFGKFKSDDDGFFFKEYDFKDINVLEAYSEDTFDDIQEKEAFLDISDDECKIVLRASCPDGFIIKGGTRPNGCNGSIQEGYMEEDKNGNMVAVIPSSSIKGVFRNYCSKIVNTLGINEDIITKMFGGEKIKEDESTKIKGQLRFTDTVIENSGKTVYSRIKVDRFTGGEYGGSIHNVEVSVVKNSDRSKLVEFEVSMPELNKQHMALIILTMRDIGMGTLNIGSGSSVGYGRFNGVEMELFHGKEVYEVKFTPDGFKGDTDKYENFIEQLKKGEHDEI